MGEPETDAYRTADDALESALHDLARLKVRMAKETGDALAISKADLDDLRAERLRLTLVRRGAYRELIRISGAPEGSDFGVAFPCVCTLQHTNGARRSAITAGSRLTFDDRKDKTLDTFLPNRGAQSAAMRSAATRYLRGETTQWLAFIGPTGTGKTHACLAIVNGLIAQGIETVYYVMSEILDELKGGGLESPPAGYVERFNTLARLPVLVIDELAVEYLNTAWQSEQIDKLLGSRYRNRFATVIASNSDAGQMPDRIASRLYDEAICTLIVCTGPDVRRAA